MCTALFLGVENIPVDRERGPAGSDRPAPQLHRRRLGPVGLDPRAANDGVAIGSTKPRPFDSPESWLAHGGRLGCRRGRFRSRRRHLGFSRSGWRGWTIGPGRNRLLRNLRHRSRRRRRRIVGGLCQEALLGSRRPSPSEIGTDDVAGDTFGSYERPHAAREQDRRNDRRAAGSAGEATAHCGRSHQGDAHEGDRPYVEQPPHSAPGNRLVDEARRRGERDDHEHGDAQALGPGRAAEEKPPQEDDQRADDSAHHRDGQNLEENDRHQPHDDEQHRNGHARPQAERFARGGLVGLGDGHWVFRVLRALDGLRCQIWRVQSRLLRSERLQHVHARGPRGGDQRCENGGADEHDGGTCNREGAGQRDVLEIAGRHPAERIAAGHAGNDPDQRR